ncbi:hypothetical protein [Mesorhizobium sp. M7A.F.Ca.MR.362.00.0.0]|nr:hypothetical protein [Mesorhizobium sp. M7A.F.Ca.MR.362.00.0.0]
MAELEAALEKRTKEYSRIQFYKKMAEIDPVSAKLVAELEQLAA